MQEIESKVLTILGSPGDFWTGGFDAAKDNKEFRWDVGNVLFWKYVFLIKRTCVAEVFTMAFCLKGKAMVMWSPIRAVTNRFKLTDKNKHVCSGLQLE